MRGSGYPFESGFLHGKRAFGGFTGAIGLGVSQNITTTFVCNPPRGFASAPGLVGQALEEMGTNDFAWWVNVPTASAGAYLAFAGDNTPTFAASRLWAIVPMVAVGQYSSCMAILLAIVPGAAGVNAAINYRTSFPYNRVYFQNGGTAQAATFSMFVTGGV